jgi:DNA-binding NtrC family response regulator
MDRILDAPAQCIADASEDAVIATGAGLENHVVRIIDVVQVISAEYAERALAMLANGSGGTEFVLTDFPMPGLDGLALLAAIREQRPRIKGAIMSGNPQESLTRCDRAIVVIYKPINPKELRRLLAEA